MWTNRSVFHAPPNASIITSGSIDTNTRQITPIQAQNNTVNRAKYFSQKNYLGTTHDLQFATTSLIFFSAASRFNSRMAFHIAAQISGSVGLPTFRLLCQLHRSLPFLYLNNFQSNFGIRNPTVDESINMAKRFLLETDRHVYKTSIHAWAGRPRTPLAWVKSHQNSRLHLAHAPSLRNILLSLHSTNRGCTPRFLIYEFEK